jgi:hypothetical protein
MTSRQRGGSDRSRIRGLELESTEIHPRLDLIFDASVRPEVRDPLTAILQWPADVWVDVALRV